MKYFIVILISISILNYLNGQIFNDGNIYLSDQGSIFIDGDFHSETGAFITLNGEIDILGNWSNNGPVFNEISQGNVMFSGRSQHVLSVITFPNLIMNGKELILDAPMTISDQFILGNGVLDLNGQELTLDNGSSNALLVEEGSIFNRFPNGGINQLPDDLDTEYVYPFISESEIAIPVILTFEEFPLKSAFINTYATNKENQPLPKEVDNFNLDGKNLGLKSVNRFWSIFPFNAKGTAKISFYSKESEGLDVDNLYLLRHQGNEWIVSDSMVFDGQFATFSLLNAGDVTLADLNFTTSTIDIVEDGAFEISPNPTSDFISISYTSLNNSFHELIVYNLMGEEVGIITDYQSGNNISLSHLAHGTYIAELRSERKKIVKKIIIQ